MISGWDWTVKMLFFILLIYRRWSGTWTTRTHWFHWSRIWITRRFRWWWQLSCRYPIHPTSVHQDHSDFKNSGVCFACYRTPGLRGGNNVDDENMEEKQVAGKLGPPVITNKRIFKMHLVLQMTGWDTCKCVHSLYGMDITADSQLTLAAWYHSSPYRYTLLTLDWLYIYRIYSLQLISNNEWKLYW